MMDDGWESYWKDAANHEFWLVPAPRVVDLIRSQDPTRMPRVLDLGSGIGRHALAFARAGFTVTALDTSKEAIERLKENASDSNLRINAIVGDYMDEIFPESSFDIVVSHNVIYHGLFEDFQKAVNLAYGYLKSYGLFFFTCPSRSDDEYGNGEEIAPHTYRPENSIHPKDVHYFADEKDIFLLLENFCLLSLDKDEYYWDNEGTRQFNSYWQILAKKRHPRFGKITRAHPVPLLKRPQLRIHGRGSGANRDGAGTMRAR